MTNLFIHFLTQGTSILLYMDCKYAQNWGNKISDK